MYWIRVFGGLLYLTGGVLCGVNFFKTWQGRPAAYAVPVYSAPALARGFVDPPAPESRLAGAQVVDLAHKIDVWVQGWWHRRWERLPLRFTLWVTFAVCLASLLQIVPTFLIRSNVPTIASVQPYTPLELVGRDLYVREGCYNCHSQMIRPILAETKRYGEYGKPGEYVYDHPFQWGSRRTGPDLAREGGKQSSLWHVLHFQDPRQVTPGSIMPRYPWLLTRELDYNVVPARIRAMHAVGVPYDLTDAQAIEQAPPSGREHCRTDRGSERPRGPGEPRGGGPRRLSAAGGHRSIRQAARTRHCDRADRPDSFRAQRHKRGEAMNCLAELVSEESLGAWKIASMLLFAAIFAGVALWACSRSREEIRQWSRSPLEEDP